MLNKVFLIGNLGRDPELRSLPSGQAVAQFSIATSRRWKDRDGNQQDETEWHNLVLFGRQAEIANQYLRKGRQIHVEGRLRTRSWEDQQSGQKRYMTEIVVESFQMLGQRDDGGERQERGSGGGYQGEAVAPGQDFDDDIPF